MPLIRRYSLISTGIMVCAGSAVLAGSALAQTLIGSAALIQNIVQGHTGGPIFAISRGDGVLLDQFVQTGTESKAKIVFLDTTNMSVGPDSAVKLDQFVYNGNGTAQTVSINATKGAFRFFSGSSAHEAYKVTTPQAVIGVRGTTYDVLIGNGQTYVKLQEGAINACVRVGTECRDLDQPGQYLIVNDSSIEGPFQANNTNFDFGSLCTGGAVALCSKQLAVNPLPPPPPGGGGFQSPAPRNNAAPLPPRPQAPQQPPRVRLTNLPVPGAANPLPAPPRAGPVRRPLVNANPDVNIPPVYIPPHRPPQIRPPQVRPPQVRSRPIKEPRITIGVRQAAPGPAALCQATATTPAGCESRSAGARPASLCSAEAPATYRSTAPASLPRPPATGRQARHRPKWHAARDPPSGWPLWLS